MSEAVQLDLLAEPQRAAHWDSPRESHDNGHVHSRRRSEKFVLGLLQQFGPMSDEHLASVAASQGCPFTPQRLRSARADLVREGRVRKSETRAKTRTGAPCAVWEVVA